VSLSGSTDTPRNGSGRHLYTLNLRVTANHGQRQGLNLSMTGILKQLKGLLPLLVLAAVSLRVVTGSPEAQINFTSIVIESYRSVGSEVDKESMLRGVVASNPTDASSISDNLKTFTTYKKYLTPESANQQPHNPPQIPLQAVGVGGNLVNLYSQKVVYQPTSHSPPAVVPSNLHTRTTSAVKSVNLENNFEEIAIDISVGEFRGHLL
jgi:hypothetical protein